MIPGPFRVITTTELSSDASTITLSDFSGIPSGSKHLVLMLSAKASAGTPEVYLRFNNDSGSNYHYERMRGVSSSSLAARSTSQTQIVVQAQMSSSAYTFGGGMVIVPLYSGTSYQKTISAQTGDTIDSVEITHGRWASTAAITRVDFVLSSNNFVAGSVAILAVMDETYLVHSVDRASSGTVVLSAAGSEDDLTVVSHLRSTRAAANDGVHIVINSDNTSANYEAISWYALGGTLTSYNHAQQWGGVPASTAPAGVFGAGEMLIQQPNNGTNYPSFHALSGYDSGTEGFIITFLGRRNSAASITSIELDAANGDMATGSFASLYKLPRNRIVNSLVSTPTPTVSGTISPTTSEALFETMYSRDDSAGLDANSTSFRLNDDAGANYGRYIFYSDASSIVSFQQPKAFPAGKIFHQHPHPSSNPGSGVYGGGCAFVIKPHKTDRYKYFFLHDGVPDSNTGVGLMILQTTRWDSVASITKWELRNYDGSANLAVGTRLQIESSNTPAATSGFFFRFLSIAAPTVGLAAASSYLSWLTNASV